MMMYDMILCSYSNYFTHYSSVNTTQHSMAFCRVFRENSIYPETDMDDLSVGATDLESSVVIFSFHKEDKDMIKKLTDRLVKNIRVEGSVESLLGAIFEIYTKNGFIGEGVEKTNIKYIFSDSVIELILEYYGENKDMMGVVEQYCYIKNPMDEGDKNGREGDTDIFSCCVLL